MLGCFCVDGVVESVIGVLCWLFDFGYCGVSYDFISVIVSEDLSGVVSIVYMFDIKCVCFEM